MSEQSVDVTQILDQHIYRELFDHRIIILADALELMHLASSLVFPRSHRRYCLFD